MFRCIMIGGMEDCRFFWSLVRFCWDKNFYSQIKKVTVSTNSDYHEDLFRRSKFFSRFPLSMQWYKGISNSFQEMSPNGWVVNFQMLQKPQFSWLVSISTSISYIKYSLWWNHFKIIIVSECAEVLWVWISVYNVFFIMKLFI